jgi:hypothetical protein
MPLHRNQIVAPGPETGFLQHPDVAVCGQETVIYRGIKRAALGYPWDKPEKHA